MQRLTTPIVCALLLLLAGCSTTRDWNKPLGQHGFETELGDAYHTQLEAQKFNPVPATGTPVVGMNGKLTKRAIDTYQNPTPEDKGPSFNEVIQFLMKDK